MGKVVYNKEFIKDEDVKVFICDRKNEDYIQFKNCPNYYGINAVDGIKKVHEIFTERLNNEESNDNKETIICLIESSSSNISNCILERFPIIIIFLNCSFAPRGK